MTSPLQQAHQAAVEEEQAAVICTVAGPRQPFSPENYSGAELQATCLRPGAYNAFALPSLFNGERRTPPQAAAHVVHTSGCVERAAVVRRNIARIDAYNAVHSEAVSVVRARAKTPKPPRPPKPPREPAPPRVKQPYLPREGSIPALLLAHLQAHGGHLTYSEIARRFGMPPSSTTAVFKKLLEERLLVRIAVTGRAALALPGYVPPAEPARPSKEFLARQAKLEKRLAEVAQLQRELRDLQPLEPAHAAVSPQPSMS